MNEYSIKIVKNLLAAVVFLVCVWLIVTGQQAVSYPSLARMLVGLAGILGLLYLYNRSFVKEKPLTIPDEQETTTHGEQ